MRMAVEGLERRERGSLRNGPVPFEKDLCTKTLQIQTKRFYLDVKENKRGKFIKVAEIAGDGRRDQIFLALSTAAEFRDHLTTFSEHLRSLEPPNKDLIPADDGTLKSDIMIKDNRRYYLDLKENDRGRFLRVSQVTRNIPRSVIAIPAQGLDDFRKEINEVLEEFGTEDGGFQREMPASQHLRTYDKGFHFDVGQNSRGVYMRISEVQSNYRTAITIPEKSFKKFRDILDQMIEKTATLEAEAVAEFKLRGVGLEDAVDEAERAETSQYPPQESDRDAERN